MATARTTPRPALHGGLSTIEYFTFGFGTMIGVGWVVVMDDWLARGGPGGGILGFLIGGLLLFPIAHTYGRLVQRIQDAGAEIAYTERVFPPLVSFFAGWTMVLSYAIVCPWEAVATGNLLVRVFPGLNSYELYAIGGTTVYAPRLAVGFALTALIAIVNYRGIKPSGVFQDVMTFGLLTIFAVFTLLGFAKGSTANMQPLFSQPGAMGPLLSIFLVMQIVPYFMTGFESVAKGSEEAKAGFDPRNFTKAIYAALFAGFLFYVIVVAVVTYVYPWREIVSGHVRTEVAFERAFGSRAIAQLILFGAFLSLLKIFNGNFVAATRMLYAIGRRNLVHPSLGRVHAVHGTPSVAVTMMAVFTLGAAMFGDALLVPVTEVGSLAVGIGWLSACAAYLAHRRPDESGTMAMVGCVVSVAIVLMKIVPGVPGSFTRTEWIAFAAWSALGVLFWLLRRRQ
ncbi:MAG TPA: APC family permease [Vicinamibacterales bacterium]|jgi:amino acid transporter|nr:APC family permease [Vicinamibacterales bacterium]